MTWQLAQGTVDFRNEDVRHRNGTDQVRRGVSDGSAVGTASSPLLPPPAECPTCIADLDMDSFCSICGKVVKA